MMKTFPLRSIAIAGLFTAASAHAQLTVEISGVGANQIPVAVANFVGETSMPTPISDIIKADLTRSGYFTIIGTGGPIAETTPINYSDWKARGATALAAGSVQLLADGRYDVRYKLFDTVNAGQTSSLAFAVPGQFARLSGHKIADDIYEKLTGVRGVFSTRIAYVTKVGREYHLEIADADGQDAHIALRSTEPIISPAWSPDGTHVAYVSFESRKPVVYVQDLVTRQRKLIANYKGSNSAPNWSPDGSHIALALSRSGMTQIYIANSDGSNLRRLTMTDGIDTEPQFAPDGQTIYFTSDRSGGPQIYKMSVNGGAAQRVTFYGDYNISPRISPDGKTLAYISRRGGKFQLYILDLASGQEQRLSNGNLDESPSFAPNNRYIMFASELRGRGTLSVVSVDGRVKQTLTTQAGDVREPTWGPFMK